VAIIDAADDLNANAANAILKTLEEPPTRTVVFLVSHSLGRLPTTVRSRCRRLTFRRTDEDTTKAAVRAVLGCSEAKAAEAAALAPGRPGEAVRLAAAGCGTLGASLSRLLDRLPNLDDAQAHALAEKVGGRDAEDLLGYFFDALGAHALIRARSFDAESWGEAWDRTRQLERDLDVLNLDPRAAALDALAAMREAAAQSSEAASAS
jgi:DNA polymerase-3 subunit delta'